jgi:hypothetical protein
MNSDKAIIVSPIDLPGQCECNPRVNKLLIEDWIQDGPDWAGHRVELKILVRHANSKAFLISNGNWTRTANQATDFNTLAEAVLFCSKYEEQNTEVVLKSSQCNFDTVLYQFSPNRRGENQQLCQFADQ